MACSCKYRYNFKNDDNYNYNTTNHSLYTALALTPIVFVALKSYLAPEATTTGSQYEAKRNDNKRGQTEGGKWKKADGRYQKEKGRGIGEGKCNRITLTMKTNIS